MIFRPSGGERRPATFNRSVARLSALLLMVIAAGCGQKSGDRGPQDRAAAISKALQQARQAVADGAQAAECALTAGAKLPATKGRLMLILDAAEGATGAADDRSDYRDKLH